jgi:tetratricopeptide (TPR) repeat protein
MTSRPVFRFLCIGALAVLLCLCAAACKKKQPPAQSPGPDSAQANNAPAHPADNKPAEPAVSEAARQSLDGMALMDAGKFAEAAEKFSSAIQADGKNGPAFLNRGICLSNLGDRQGALSDFTRAAELMPGDKAPPFLKADVLYEMQRYDEAEKEFTALAARFPDEAAGHYYLGVFAARHGDLPQALEHIKAALGKDPSLEPALAERACLCAISEDFDQSFADIKRLREINDGIPAQYLYAVVHLMRGRTLMDQSNADKNPALAQTAFEDFKEAEATLGTMLDKTPDVTLALAYAETVASQSTADAPLYEVADRQFQQILSTVDPQLHDERAENFRIYLPRLHRGLAVTCIARGDEKAAAEHLKQIIAFAGDFKALWERDDGAPLVDKWLAYRVICDAMQALAKIYVSSQNDYASAEACLNQLQKFQALVNADYGSAAAVRQKERDAVQEAIYECEFQKIVPAASAQYTYEQCAAFLSHPYYKIRAAGLVCLSQGRDQQANDRIVGALDDADERVAVVAAQIAGEKGIKSAVPKLAAMLKRCGPDAAITVVGALGKLTKNSATSDGNLILSEETRAAVPALIDALENEDIRVREAAINALKEITGRTQMYHHDDPPEARAQAVERWKKWWDEISAGAPEEGNAGEPRPQLNAH